MKMILDDYEDRFRSRNSPADYNQMNTSRFTLREPIETAGSIEEQYQKFTLATANMIAAHKSIFDTRPTIGDLYIPRRRRWGCSLINIDTALPEGGA
ncbi:hypothetical protein ACOTWP_20770 [Enterobacter cloacae complex sp. CDL018]|uniref:hypothetical protein n=1 Tax=Enterobacter cloacae complex TaxID=354276 RepID=UPI0013DF6EDA|nr:MULTISPECIES: hypothetical protein [Enterobacter cloacae complex]ELC7456550.1 hypothetical protein [Enterobacter hormaechei]ELJ6239940.1 hypothetical protein [Enterobacter hormaechei]ELZ5043435.1 hypothetical protein [Enterobacter hormaechei]MBT1748111.1 hypothetical protein [Enterobacter hormaechei subsp. xiangfangensis]MCM7752900.1 hypothetical protein [Enterobacter hormaechei]